MPSHGWRCLVPAPVYYEWRDDPDGKTPFGVARLDGDPVAFGGVWETWKSPDGETPQTFATITTEANRQLAGIQGRMPVIIESEDWPHWLGEAEGDPSSLLRPAPEDVCGSDRWVKAVGNFRNDGPEHLCRLSPCFFDQVARAAAFARFRCNGSASSNAGIGNVHTRLSKSRRVPASPFARQCNGIIEHH